MEEQWFISREYEASYRTDPVPMGAGLGPAKLFHEAINEYFDLANAFLRQTNAFTAQGMRDYFYANPLGRLLTKRFSDGKGRVLYADNLTEGWPPRDQIHLEITCMTNIYTWKAVCPDHPPQRYWVHSEAIKLDVAPFARNYDDRFHPQGRSSQFDHHLGPWPGK